MKVLYLIHSTTMNGATISLLNLILGLQKVGISPIIAGPALYQEWGREDFFIKLKESGILYYPLNVPKQIWPKMSSWLQVVKWVYNLFWMILWTRKGEKQLREIVLKERPNLIHTNTGVLHLGYKISKQEGIPHVWHLREYQDLDFGWKIFPSKSTFVNTLKDNNYVISITDGVLEHFHLTGHPRCRRLYDGNLSEKEVSHPIKKENYFLCCSQVIASKGHDSAIKAFAKFYKHHKDYKLVILGFGDTVYIGRMKALAAEQGCVDGIEWKGYTNDIKSYMVKAKALIVASRFEGFGRMTAEAGMLGCITLGRNTGGTKEILDNIGGYLFDDDEGLYMQMEAVAQLPDEEYYAKAIDIQKKAIDSYSIEQNVKAIKALYDSILKQDEV